MPRIRLNLTLSPAAANALDRLAREIAAAEGRDPERCRSMAVERLIADCAGNSGGGGEKGQR